MEKRLERLAFLLFVITLLGVVLGFDPRPGGEFRRIKEQIGGVGILAGFAILMAAGVFPRKAPPIAFPLLQALAALSLLGILSGVVGAHRWETSAALLALAVGGLAFWGWSSVWTKDTLGKLLDLWLLATALSAGVALLQLFQVPFGLKLMDAAGVGLRYEVVGLAGNPGDLAASLVAAFLWAIYRYLETRERRFLLAAGLSLTGTLATGTITALAALLVGAGFAFRVAGKGRDFALKLALLFLAVFGIGVALLPFLSARWTEKVAQLVGGEWDALLSGRLDGWRVAWYLAQKHPWLGVGLGAFGNEFVEAKARLLEAGVRFFPDQLYPIFENAHSEPLELLAELGGFGGSLALLAFSLGVFRFLSRGRSCWTPLEHGLALGVTLALTILAVFGFPFRVAVVSLPFLLLAAWLAAERERVANPEELLLGKGLRWRIGGVLLLATGGLTLGVLGFQQIQALHLLSAMEAQSQEAVEGGRVDPRAVFRNLQELERLRARLPGEVAVPLAQANQLFLLGKFQRAVEVYDEAQRLSRRPEIHFNLALALEQLGCHASAEWERQWAVYLDPAIARRLGMDPRALPLPPPLLFASDFECGFRGWQGPDSKPKTDEKRPAS
jgi:O-antigen ligase